MKDAPLISVVVPTYNRANLLEVTLNSILKQTYKNIEIIVVSDASKDETASVVRKYDDPRIKFFDLKENLKYPSKVRNFGISQASGEFIAFCDDDDIWVDDKLDKQIRCLLNSDNLQMVASNAYIFPGNVLPSMLMIRSKNISYSQLLKKNSIITSSVLIRTSALENIGFFDENEDLHIGEDWDLWLRILRFKEGSVRILKECLVYYRIGNLKITNQINSNIKLYSAKMYIYKKYSSDQCIDLNECFKCEQKVREIIEKKSIKQNFMNKLYSKEISLVKAFSCNKFDLRFRFAAVIKFAVKYLYKAIFCFTKINSNSL